MAMNVKVVSTLDNEVNDIRMATAEIINEKILPHEADLWGVRREMTPLKRQSRKRRELRKDVQDAVKQKDLGLRTCLKSLAEWV